MCLCSAMALGRNFMQRLCLCSARSSIPCNYWTGVSMSLKMSLLDVALFVIALLCKSSFSLNLTCGDALCVRVEYEICSTICGTPVQAISDHKDLTELAWGVREGQNLPQNGLNLALEPSRGPQIGL